MCVNCAVHFGSHLGMVTAVICVANLHKISNLSKFTMVHTQDPYSANTPTDAHYAYTTSRRFNLRCSNVQRIFRNSLADREALTRQQLGEFNTFHAINASLPGRLNTIRLSLGQAMMWSFDNRNWQPFREEYNRRKHSFDLQPSDDVEKNDIVRLLLSKNWTHQYDCKASIVQESENLMMVVVNSMCLPLGWVIGGDIVDDGNLMHLAIRLAAPVDVLEFLARDSCGYVFQVRSKANGPFGESTPIEYYLRMRRGTLQYRKVKTLTKLLCRYEWCSPLYFPYSGWEMVKELALYDNGYYARRTTDILLEFHESPLHPVLEMAINYDLAVATSDMSDDIKKIFQFESEDMGGREPCLFQKMLDVSNARDTVDEIYWVIRSDPTGFLACLPRDYL